MVKADRINTTGALALAAAINPTAPLNSVWLATAVTTWGDSYSQAWTTAQTILTQP